jgi:hypothetical protein
VQIYKPEGYSEVPILIEPFIGLAVLFATNWPVEAMIILTDIVSMSSISSGK